MARAEARELGKLAAALERAEGELTKREQALEAAQAERDEAAERTAADAFIDGNPESARLNGKASRRAADAIAARDHAAAAVRGIRARGVELAERVASQKITDAEKARDEAVKIEQQAEQALADARAVSAAADLELDKASREAKYALAIFGGAAAEAKRRAEESDARNVLAAVRGTIRLDILPAHLRERVPAARERLREEEERAREGYKKSVEAGTIKGVRVVSPPRGLRDGERFPRL